MIPAAAIGRVAPCSRNQAEQAGAEQSSFAAELVSVFIAFWRSFGCLTLGVRRRNPCPPAANPTGDLLIISTPDHEDALVTVAALRRVSTVEPKVDVATAHKAARNTPNKAVEVNGLSLGFLDSLTHGLPFLVVREAVPHLER